jgi:Zn-dependent peptidase ImmA (M78 family)
MQAIETRWGNPEVLKWARKRLNLTREKVIEEARKLSRHHYAGVTVRQLAEWEAGESKPELEHLETLAEIYHCPVGYFFLDKAPDEPLPLSFRGLAREKVEKLASTTRMALYRFHELAQWTIYLTDTLGIQWQPNARQREYQPDLRDIDQAVTDKRSHFGWTREVRASLAKGPPEEAFAWWRQAIESEGVFCFSLKLEPEEVRGASLWLSNLPFILVNHQDVEAASGRIFTLLHEYAHLITAGEGTVCDFRGLQGGQNPEPFANRFAARILLSPNELKERLREIDQDKLREDWHDTLLDEIRRPLLVSRDVVAITLEELQLAPRGLYERKRQRWEARRPWGRRRGKRPTKKEIKFREIGYSLDNLLTSHSENPSFPWLDVSQLLDTKVEKVSEFVRWASQRKQLRLERG